jgi:nitrogen fixation protein FixH
MSALRLIPERLEGRHVLIALLAFFGVMLLANGIFLFYALDTFNGFDTADAYRKGLNYNARITSQKAQAALGWQPVARYETDTGRLVVEVRDRRGRGVAGLFVSGEIRRPVTDRYDHAVALHETAAALYTARDKLGPGQWVFSGKISAPGKSGKTAFRFKRRLWVKESP